LIEDVDSDPDSDVECLTVHEAADIAASGKRNVDVVILPPSTIDAVSDEEVGDEDDLTPSSLPSDVAGPLVVHFHKDGHDDTEVRSAETHKTGKQLKSQKHNSPKWKDKCDYKEPVECQPLSKLCQSHPELAVKKSTGTVQCVLQ